MFLWGERVKFESSGTFLWKYFGYCENSEIALVAWGCEQKYVVYFRWERNSVQTCKLRWFTDGNQPQI